MQPGEIGFGGLVAYACPEHGTVVWCVCKLSPEERARRQEAERKVMAVLEKIAKEKGK
jgi:hypothetical protein